MYTACPNLTLAVEQHLKFLTLNFKHTANAKLQGPKGDWDFSAYFIQIQSIIVIETSIIHSGESQH